MTYEMKPLPFDPQKIRGLSERILISHYENNYGGPVAHSPPKARPLLARL